MIGTLCKSDLDAGAAYVGLAGLRAKIGENDVMPSTRPFGSAKTSGAGKAVRCGRGLCSVVRYSLFSRMPLTADGVGSVGLVRRIIQPRTTGTQTYYATAGVSAEREILRCGAATLKPTAVRRLLAESVSSRHLHDARTHTHAYARRQTDSTGSHAHSRTHACGCRTRPRKRSWRNSRRRRQFSRR